MSIQDAKFRHVLLSTVALLGIGFPLSSLLPIGAASAQLTSMPTQTSASFLFKNLSQQSRQPKPTIGSLQSPTPNPVPRNFSGEGQPIVVPGTGGATQIPISNTPPPQDPIIPPGLH